MKKLIAVITVLFLPLIAAATTTWTTDTSQSGTIVRVSVATCTTGTESAMADGPGTAPNLVGIDLYGLKGVVVQVEAAAAMTAGGKLLAYILNPITNKWGRATWLDITVSNVQYETYPGINVNVDWSRLAFIPSGVGQAAVIYLSGRRLPISLRS